MTEAPAGDDHRVLNAMSVDVEDYFHVSVFDGIVPRTEWDDMESRVCGNTDRLLDIFDECTSWPRMAMPIASSTTRHRRHFVRTCAGQSG